MEDTMSSYSFSHQFYQRWTCAPEPIRAAITQELKDITTLLQADTVFESFVFQTPDLDTHVDELYENHRAEQAIAQAIIDKQEQERAAAEKKQLEEEQQKQAEASKRHEQAEAAKKQSEKSQQSEVVEGHIDDTQDAADTEQTISDSDTSLNGTSYSDVAHNDTAINNTSSTEKVVSKESNVEKTSSGESSRHLSRDDDSSENKVISEQVIELSDNQLKDIQNKASTAIHLSLKDAKLDAAHQTLIRELEMQVDDYLSEQMMLMSENLKSWLRAEVTQHFNAQNTSANNEATEGK